MADGERFHPSLVAAVDPDRPAIVMGAAGAVITYGELDARTNQVAQALRTAGLEPGDGVAILVENHPRFLDVAWAAQSSGLYYTALNTHLTADELAYIVRDSGARALVTTATYADVAATVLEACRDQLRAAWMIGGTAPGFEPFETVVEREPITPVADGTEGDFMLYSSGTTGQPKGIRRPLRDHPLGVGSDIVVGFLSMFGIGPGTVYLSPAPLYHAAPLGWCMGVHRLGGCVVVMERFDPLAFLQHVERHQITHTQVVPTMFVRMLKLDEHERSGHDLGSLRMVMHAAAPCPPEVKRQMIDWWGPIIYEHYSSTEGMGMTLITADEWLQHPGSVGKPLLGAVHVLGEDGQELGPGEVGALWFEEASFEYHNDPQRTAEAKNAAGWGTVGDIGYVDEEGFVYLTDRRSFTIISGGVNIYPQEIENVLIAHPAVADVAVFGVPDPDFGEAVKAVVQPVAWPVADDDLGAELLAYCRERLAGYKCPASIDFEAALPRSDTGKLYKRLLRDRYWSAASSP